jgi:hypothetical protein
MCFSQSSFRASVQLFGIRIGMISWSSVGRRRLLEELIGFGTRIAQLAHLDERTNVPVIIVGIK